MSWLLLVRASLAAEPVLLTQTPVLGDASSTSVVQIYLPELREADRVRVVPTQGEVLEVQRQGQVLTVLLRPPTARRQDDDMPLTVKVRGSMKMDTELRVPLRQRTQGGLELSSALQAWRPGARAPVQLRIEPTGTHGLPVSARQISMRASQGEITKISPNTDGSWTATWRPPSRSNGEATVLFAATDLSAPEQLHGLMVLPVTGASEGAPQPMLIAPFASRVPAGAEVQIWVAAPQAKPTMQDSLSLQDHGLGWSSVSMKVPERRGAWVLKASTEGDSDTLTLQVRDPLPSLTMRSDPALLGNDTRSLSVSASVQGRASQVRFSATGASVNGSTKTSGQDLTQRYRVPSSSDRVVITAAALTTPSGLPATRLLLWSPQAALPSDGKTQNTLIVVAVDALGMPVKGVSVDLKVPIGDARVQPSATTDSRGLAVVQLTSGLSAGPVRMAASTKNGLESELILWQGEGAPSAAQVGSAEGRELLATIQSATPVLMLPRIQGSVGEPSAVLVSTTPQYTTPGAAVLVTLRIQDAQGLPVAGAKPILRPSLGEVGPITDNGDGSYLVAVQLPPGQDGPLTVHVSAGDAKGSVLLPSLEDLGGVTALAEDGSVKEPEPEPDPDKPPRDKTAPTGAPLGLIRFSLMDQSYSSTLGSTGSEGVPLGAEFNHALPFGVPGFAFQASFFPSSGNFGVDLRTRVGVARVVLGAGPLEETLMDPIYPTMVGLRARTLGDSVRVGAGAWAHVHDATVFTYADDARATVSLESQLLYGLRLGVILEVDTPSVGLEILVAETLGPTPQATHASVALDLKVLPGAAFLTLGAELDLQHTQIQVSGDTVEMSSQMIAAKAGVGTSF